MKQKSGPGKVPAERVLKDIRPQTRRQYSAEEKIRIVLEGLRGEENISELCRREGIAASMYYGWSKEFLGAGKRRLAGDTACRDLRRGEGSSSGSLGVEGGRGRSHPGEPPAHLPAKCTLDKLGIPRATFYLYGRFSRCKSIFDLICLASCKHLSDVTR
jgi:transposase